MSRSRFWPWAKTTITKTNNIRMTFVKWLKENDSSSILPNGIENNFMYVLSNSCLPVSPLPRVFHQRHWQPQRREQLSHSQTRGSISSSGSSVQPRLSPCQWQTLLQSLPNNNLPHLHTYSFICLNGIVCKRMDIDLTVWNRDYLGKNIDRVW